MDIHPYEDLDTKMDSDSEDSDEDITPPLGSRMTDSDKDPTPPPSILGKRENITTDALPSPKKLRALYAPAPKKQSKRARARKAEDEGSSSGYFPWRAIAEKVASFRVSCSVPANTI